MAPVHLAMMEEPAADSHPRHQRRIFEFHEDERGVEYEPEYDRYDALKSTLVTYTSLQQQQLVDHPELIGSWNKRKRNEDENEHEISLINKTPSEEKVLNDEERDVFLVKMEKSLIEFHGIQRVIQLLKQKEHLNLLTCTRPSNPIKGPLLPVKQRVHLRQQSMKDCQEYFIKATDKAQELVRERRNFALQCIELRKKWRLIRSPNAGPSGALLTHRDEISIDCSYLTAGDVTLVNKHTVSIPIHRQNYIPSRPSNDYYTLQYSLKHVQYGELCTQTLWNILYGELNPLREKYSDESDVPQSDLLAWQCRLTQHDVSVRSFFASLVNIERESRLLNTDSILYDMWNTTSSSIISADISSSLLSGFLEEPLTGPLHVVSHTRSQIIISLTSSLQLILAQAPLFQPIAEEGNNLQSSPSLLSPVAPSYSSHFTSDLPSCLSSTSLLTMIHSAALAMESILMTAQRNQYSSPSITKAQSQHAISHSSTHSSSFTPHSSEFNWKTFLSQPFPKQKQTPKFHYTYRDILLSMKEILQSHLLFYRFVYNCPVTSSLSPFSPFTSQIIHIPRRGLTLQSIPNSSSQYYLSSQFLFHITIAGGHWKHNSLPHYLRLHIFPSYLQLEDTSPIQECTLSSSDLISTKIRTDCLLIPPPSELMNYPRSFQGPPVGFHRFENCELFWKYLYCHTLENEA